MALYHLRTLINRFMMKLAPSTQILITLGTATGGIGDANGERIKEICREKSEVLSTWFSMVLSPSACLSEFKRSDS